MDDVPMRFEMWLGKYLGATATASIWDGPQQHLLPFANRDDDGSLIYRLTGAPIDGFLDALYNGPLNAERRWVLGLPLLARSWIEQHQGTDAAAGSPTLVAIPLTATGTGTPERPLSSTRTVTITGDVEPVPIVFKMIGPTVVVDPGESLRLVVSGPSEAELTIGYGKNGISLFRDETLTVEVYGTDGERIDTTGFA